MANKFKVTIYFVEIGLLDAPEVFEVTLHIQDEDDRFQIGEFERNHQESGVYGLLESLEQNDNWLSLFLNHYPYKVKIELEA